MIRAFGQELNPESYAICKGDMLIKGQEADNIKRGNSFSDDGLPELLGKTAVDVSPANPERVWAMVEADPGGGLYRSDDSGGSWRLVSEDLPSLWRSEPCLA